MREWLQALGVKALYIAPGSPWENGYIESFTGIPWIEIDTADDLDQAYKLFSTT